MNFELNEMQLKESQIPTKYIKNVSLITYERGGRIANVRIDSSSTRGTEVWVTVSPRDTGSSNSK